MRCCYDTCKRRVNSFSTIECICGYSFCEYHRLMSEHDCKQLQIKQEKYREKLKTSNPVVKKEKFEKIN